MSGKRRHLAGPEPDPIALASHRYAQVLQTPAGGNADPGDWPAWITKATRRDGLNYALAAATARAADVPVPAIQYELQAYAVAVDGLEEGASSSRVADAMGIAYESESCAVSLFKAGGRPTRFTAQELVSMDLRPPQYLVEGVIPEGVTLLAGKPKFGKSYLALGLSFALASGGRALGSIPVEQCDVLHLHLEGGMAGLKGRIVGMCGGNTLEAAKLVQTAPAGLVFDTGWPRGEAGVEALDDYLHLNPDTRFVVIDTLTLFRQAVGPKSSSSYSDEYEATTAITKCLHYHGVHGMIVHHASKRSADMTDDVLDLISGTTGLVAGVDNGAVLTNTSTGAVLAVVPRDLEAVQLAVERDTEIGTWRVMGNAEDHHLSGLQSAIMGKLRELDRASQLPVSAKDLAVLLEGNADSVRRTLHRMSQRTPPLVAQVYGSRWGLAYGKQEGIEAETEEGTEAEAPEAPDDTEAPF